MLAFSERQSRFSRRAARLKSHSSLDREARLRTVVRGAITEILGKLRRKLLKVDSCWSTQHLSMQRRGTTGDMSAAATGAPDRSRRSEASLSEMAWSTCFDEKENSKEKRVYLMRSLIHVMLACGLPALRCSARKRFWTSFVRLREKASMSTYRRLRFTSTRMVVCREPFELNTLARYSHTRGHARTCRSLRSETH